MKRLSGLWGLQGLGLVAFAGFRALCVFYGLGLINMPIGHKDAKV